MNRCAHANTHLHVLQETHDTGCVYVRVHFRVHAHVYTVICIYAYIHTQMGFDICMHVTNSMYYTHYTGPDHTSATFPQTSNSAAEQQDRDEEHEEQQINSE